MSTKTERESYSPVEGRVPPFRTVVDADWISWPSPPISYNVAEDPDTSHSPYRVKTLLCQDFVSQQYYIVPYVDFASATSGPVGTPECWEFLTIGVNAAGISAPDPNSEVYYKTKTVGLPGATTVRHRVFTDPQINPDSACNHIDTPSSNPLVDGDPVFLKVSGIPVDPSNPPGGATITVTFRIKTITDPTVEPPVYLYLQQRPPYSQSVTKRR